MGAGDVHALYVLFWGREVLAERRLRLKSLKPIDTHEVIFFIAPAPIASSPNRTHAQTVKMGAHPGDRRVRPNDGPEESRDGDSLEEMRDGDSLEERREGDGPEELRDGDSPGELRGRDSPGELRGRDGHPSEKRVKLIQVSATRIGAFVQVDLHRVPPDDLATCLRRVCALKVDYRWKGYTNGTASCIGHSCYSYVVDLLPPPSPTLPLLANAFLLCAFIMLSCVSLLCAGCIASTCRCIIRIARRILRVRTMHSFSRRGIQKGQQDRTPRNSTAERQRKQFYLYP